MLVREHYLWTFYYSSNFEVPMDVFQFRWYKVHYLEQYTWILSKNDIDETVLLEESDFLLGGAFMIGQEILLLLWQ